MSGDDVPPPAPAATTVGRDFSAAQILFHSAIADVMGLSPGDYKCLDLLMRAPEPVTATALAQMCGLTTGAVTGVVDRLERDGYAVRTRDVNDRRRVLVRAAENVRKKFQWIFEPLSEAFEELDRQFDAAELATISRYMVGATAVFHQQTERALERAKMP